MLDAINKVVLHIEENFHEELNKAIIESKTGYTYNHIRKRFKVLVGMTMDKYRIRRQIALILNEINLSGKFIKDCNLEPWSDYNSFRLACEREYSCSPSALIKSYAFILQDKIDVNKIQKENKLYDLLMSYNVHERYIIKFFLSLKPVSSGNVQFYKVINDPVYGCKISPFFSLSNFDSFFYKKIRSKECKKMIKGYYLDAPVIFGGSNVKDNYYWIPSRNVLKKLFRNINSFPKYNFDEICTIWFFEEEMKKIIQNNLSDYRPKIYGMPFELIEWDNSKINYLELIILRILIKHEMEINIIKDFDNLLDKVNKQIAEKLVLENDDLYEKKNINVISMVELKDAIISLFMKGLLYFKSSK